MGKQAPLVLASASPRRRELLRTAGYRFEVAAPKVAEPLPTARELGNAAAWSEALAYFKARAVGDARPEAVVIGADTVVARGAEIIGKPEDESDARRMLATLFAGESAVITGVTVLPVDRTRRVITHEVSRLVMRAMSAAEIEEYIAGGAWRDKAGAYALQEGGDRFLERLEGSVSNVVGLPMERLSEILARLGVYPERDDERDAAGK